MDNFVNNASSKYFTGVSDRELKTLKQSTGSDCMAEKAKVSEWLKIKNATILTQ